MKIAIIPARGGSKRIPRKNIRPFSGRPMISYAIDAARSSGLFDRVIVSTEDEEIATIAGSTGAEVPFMRPHELADDHTGTVAVIVHAIQACRALGWEIHQACCIYPGVPMIQANDLQQADCMLAEGDTPFVLAVAPFPSAVQRALRRNEAGQMIPFHCEHINTRSQDLEAAYYDAGQFCFGLAQAWLCGQSPHLHGKGMVIPQWRAVDIDTPEDWHRAELLYRAIHAPGRE